MIKRDDDDYDAVVTTLSVYCDMDHPRYALQRLTLVCSYACLRLRFFCRFRQLLCYAAAVMSRVPPL